MNWLSFVTYVAIGGLSKLFTMRYPSPGEQIAAGATVVVQGLAAGLIVPMQFTKEAIIIFMIFYAGEVAGRIGAWAIDKTRLWIDEKRHDGRTN